MIWKQVAKIIKHQIANLDFLFFTMSAMFLGLSGSSISVNFFFSIIDFSNPPN